MHGPVQRLGNLRPDAAQYDAEPHLFVARDSSTLPSLKSVRLATPRFMSSLMTQPKNPLGWESWRATKRGGMANLSVGVFAR